MKVTALIAKSLAALIALLAGICTSANAQTTAPEKSRDNLMVVLRESIGANRPDESLKPTGKLKGKISDGREVEFEMASWEFIGDMHLRLVFDGPQSMIGATPQDLAALGLTNVQDALATALANIKRVYGDPVASPWTDGVMQIQGKSPDLDSSYFLDREFWRRLLKAQPEGLVVAVPKRGGLLYVPVADTKAVEGLRKGIVHLHSSSGRLRISSGLYLFRDDKWSVFQDPVKQ